MFTSSHDSIVKNQSNHPLHSRITPIISDIIERNFSWRMSNYATRSRKTFSDEWDSDLTVQITQSCLDGKMLKRKLTWSWRTIWPAARYCSCWTWCQESTFSALQSLGSEPRRTSASLFANASASMWQSVRQLRKIDLGFDHCFVICGWSQKKISIVK